MRPWTGDDEEDGLGDVLGAHHARQLGHVRGPPVTHGEVGGDAAGADAGAAHALLAQLVVEGARQADLGELRGAVGGLVAAGRGGPPRWPR